MHGCRIAHCPGHAGQEEKPYCTARSAQASRMRHIALLAQSRCEHDGSTVIGETAICVTFLVCCDIAANTSMASPHFEPLPESLPEPLPEPLPRPFPGQTWCISHCRWARDSLVWPAARYRVTGQMLPLGCKPRSSKYLGEK